MHVLVGAPIRVYMMHACVLRTGRSSYTTLHGLPGLTLLIKLLVPGRYRVV